MTWIICISISIIKIKIIYYIHEKYYNDAIVNISLMSLHLLGLSPTLWGDKLVKDSKGKETMWSRISVFCAAHLWQLIDQIAHLITSCVHKLMSCHVPKEKVLAVWDHALGKRQNGCRLSACFGPSAGLCKGSLESGEQQLSPAPCSKVSNHAENCQHRPKPNTHMQNISDYAVVYLASIWSALTAQYVYIYITRWCFFLYFWHVWNILEVQGRRTAMLKPMLKPLPLVFACSPSGAPIQLLELVASNGHGDPSFLKIVLFKETTCCLVNFHTSYLILLVRVLSISKS